MFEFTTPKGVKPSRESGKYEYRRRPHTKNDARIAAEPCGREKVTGEHIGLQDSQGVPQRMNHPDNQKAEKRVSESRYDLKTARD